MHTLSSLATADQVRVAISTAARARRIALRMTQTDLSARSGVALATLKRFEQRGRIGIEALLQIATALDALEGFTDLFPGIEQKTLDDLERSQKPRLRVRHGARS